MTFLKKATGSILFGTLCFSVGKFLSPAKVEMKEVVKKETIRPDGTRIIETVSETKRTTDKQLDKESQKETKTTERPDWLVTVSYAPTYANSVQSYALSIQRRMFSEIYLGAFVTSQKQIGLSISMGF